MLRDLGTEKQEEFLTAVLDEPLGEEDDISQFVEKCLACLPKRVRHILKAKFGLLGGFVFDDKEIATIFNVNQKEVGAIVKRAIALIKTSRKGVSHD